MPGLWVVEGRNHAALVETTPMFKTKKTLSVAQLLILTTAAARADDVIMPLPSGLRARGASLQRLLASLLKLMLVEESPTDTLGLAWRTDEQGVHYALKLTAAGLESAGGLAEPPAEQSSGAASTVDEVIEAAAGIEDATEAGTSPAPCLTPPAGKLGQVLAAVGAGRGATIDELATLTGWLPHATRAALTRLKQRGFPVHLVKQADRKAYHLSAGGGA
jgi:hypothetical protein